MSPKLKTQCDLGASPVFLRDRACSGEVMYFKDDAGTYRSRCRGHRERFKYEKLEEVSQEEYEAHEVIQE